VDKIIEVYKKYEHLDQLLSDAEWLEGEQDSLINNILYDLWGAIKETINETNKKGGGDNA